MAICRRRGATSAAANNARWREVRDEAKYGKLLIFARVLPLIRARVAQDLKRPGLPRDRVLAAVVRVMELTLFPRRQQ